MYHLAYLAAKEETAMKKLLTHTPDLGIVFNVKELVNVIRVRSNVWFW